MLQVTPPYAYILRDNCIRGKTTSISPKNLPSATSDKIKAELAEAETAEMTFNIKDETHDVSRIFANGVFSK